MKKLLPVILLSLALAACTGRATTRFYPVQGPIAAQTPAAVYVGTIAGGMAGTITLTGYQGEVYKGRWATIEQPKQSTDSPSGAPGDREMVSLWDSIYGNGFYVAHVLGSKWYAKAVMTGSSGNSLKAEFYREARDNHGDGNALLASIKGVAMDDKGNVYKVTIS